MRYSNSRDESKKKIYWFYLLLFMREMNPFIEGSEKNGSGPPAGNDFGRSKTKNSGHLLATQHNRGSQSI